MRQQLEDDKGKFTAIMKLTCFEHSGCYNVTQLWLMHRSDKRTMVNHKHFKDTVGC